MSLFDQLVNEALRSCAELTSLRPVVEKELLHHDILREMSEAGLLTGRTFFCDTCYAAQSLRHRPRHLGAHLAGAEPGGDSGGQDHRAFRTCGGQRIGIACQFENQLWNHFLSQPLIRRL